jgi:hypothetical protein
MFFAVGRGHEHGFGEPLAEGIGVEAVSLGRGRVKEPNLPQGLLRPRCPHSPQRCAAREGCKVRRFMSLPPLVDFFLRRDFPDDVRL